MDNAEKLENSFLGFGGELFRKSFSTCALKDF